MVLLPTINSTLPCVVERAVVEVLYRVLDCLVLVLSECVYPVVGEVVVAVSHARSRVPPTKRPQRSKGMFLCFVLFCFVLFLFSFLSYFFFYPPGDG